MDQSSLPCSLLPQDEKAGPTQDITQSTRPQPCLHSCFTVPETVSPQSENAHPWLFQGHSPPPSQCREARAADFGYDTGRTAGRTCAASLDILTQTQGTKVQHHPNTTSRKGQTTAVHQVPRMLLPRMVASPSWIHLTEPNSDTVILILLGPQSQAAGPCGAVGADRRPSQVPLPCCTAPEPVSSCGHALGRSRAQTQSLLLPLSSPCSSPGS